MTGSAIRRSRFRCTGQSLGSLNPESVGWLSGFPSGWTIPDAQSIKDKIPSEPPD